MRAMKFRAWDSDKKEKMLFDLWDLACCDDYFFKPMNTKNSRRGKNLKIMQFTGLHDKNGKEIYEGDIIQVSILWNEFNRKIKRSYISQIMYNTHRCSFIFPEYYNIAVNDARESDEIIEFEVRGNIYENPELIKAI